MKQKILSILLVVSMTLLLLPAQAQALAADVAGAAEGTDTASRSYAADAEENILPLEPVSAREAEQFDPAETLMKLEPEPDGIFKNGAFTGRQTISDIPELLDGRTQILYNRILSRLLLRMDITRQSWTRLGFPIPLLRAGRSASSPPHAGRCRNAAPFHRRFPHGKTW